MINKKFISIDNFHEINTSIIDNFCYFSIEKLTIENYKTFLLLLRDILMYINNHKIKFIKQQILVIDLPYFKRSTTYKTNQNDDQNDDQKFVWITTKIEEFMEEILDALNIKH
jgi:hypothetical protein